MARHCNGEISLECPEVIGVLIYLHEKGTTEPFRWQSGMADLATYEAIHSAKIMADPLAVVPTPTEDYDEDSDEEFYLTNEKDLL